MRNRNNNFLVRLNDDEYKKLNEKVARTNLSREQFVRELLNDAEIKDSPPADYVELIMQVRRVGSNINQLLKLANAKGIIIANDLRIALEKNYKVEDMLWNVFAVK